ncbi:hypothetical protein ACU686_29475 [Yinghuangia aomiensis]
MGHAPDPTITSQLLALNDLHGATWKTRMGSAANIVTQHRPGHRHTRRCPQGKGVAQASATQAARWREQ